MERIYSRISNTFYLQASQQSKTVLWRLAKTSRSFSVHVALVSIDAIAEWFQLNPDLIAEDYFYLNCVTYILTPLFPLPPRWRFYHIEARSRLGSALQTRQKQTVKVRNSGQRFYLSPYLYESSNLKNSLVMSENVKHEYDLLAFFDFALYYRQKQTRLRPVFTIHFRLTLCSHQLMEIWKS